MAFGVNGPVLRILNGKYSVLDYFDTEFTVRWYTVATQ